MSLNPRAIATLGVGFGAVSVAYLGLWPVSTPVEPPIDAPYRPRAAAPFIVDYTPELPDVLVRLEAIEARDTARIHIGTGALDALAGLVVTESSDGAAFTLDVVATTTIEIAEPADGGALALRVDWSDDDREFEEVMAALLT